MQLYYLSLLLFALCSLVAAQECVTPISIPICKPAYNISSQHNNNTVGSSLFSFFSSNRPSRPCALAYSRYQCSLAYPECNTTSPKEVCSNVCESVIDACVNDTALFAGAALPFPSQSDCDARSNSTTANCSATSTVDISSFYTECAVPDINKLAKDGPTSEIICTIRRPVSIKNDSYDLGRDVWLRLKNLTQSYQNANNNQLPNSTMRACFESYASYFCFQAFPNCTASLNPAQTVPVCRSACAQVPTECEPFRQYFADKSWLPALATCRELPTTGCTNPNLAELNLEFFSFTDSSDSPTIAPPTRRPSGGSGGVIYPPGGPGTGAGVGVGVLIGLLLIIGALMLIMKKQDAR